MGQVRAERKEQTRRALLSAALDLSGDSSLGSVSLRQVAKHVGIVPTGFYRHFSSVEELGLALVDESFTSLRALLRDVRAVETGASLADDASASDVVDASVDIIVTHVEAHQPHFAFIARERAAGPPAVRDAIRHELDLCARELATDLARVGGADTWSGEDLRILADLFVTTMTATAESLLRAEGRPAARTAVVQTARTQLRMILVGAFHWRSDRS
ncbi:TetR family transcriptional regulator [Nocardioides bruguierae]|uniref:TetR family transcriptional regulator n=1 Tax=Nocardioides bruguierae TaxID=2945102 RepID=A0A9X2IDF5_9ACTN|nr:TetR family transcriptional regulator [Nocardioides bruguierae]MCL8024802.1 TetR family transcriptional regulator [Nocardioides bruguierae]MCM0619207.1 TetR family transcriptional regulator [Nocardioides bruguierae]